MSDVNSLAFQKLSASLKEIQKKLLELSNEDFSNLHVGINWSWMPYVKDHLVFLTEQTSGLVDSLQDSPPPTLDKNLADIKKQNS